MKVSLRSAFLAIAVLFVVGGPLASGSHAASSKRAPRVAVKKTNSQPARQMPAHVQPATQPAAASPEVAPAAVVEPKSGNLSMAFVSLKDALFATGRVASHSGSAIWSFGAAVVNAAKGSGKGIVSLFKGGSAAVRASNGAKLSLYDGDHVKANASFDAASKDFVSAQEWAASATDEFPATAEQLARSSKHLGGLGVEAVYATWEAGKAVFYLGCATANGVNWTWNKVSASAQQATEILRSLGHQSSGSAASLANAGSALIAVS